MKDLAFLWAILQLHVYCLKEWSFTDCKKRQSQLLFCTSSTSLPLYLFHYVHLMSMEFFMFFIDYICKSNLLQKLQNLDILYNCEVWPVKFIQNLYRILINRNLKIQRWLFFLMCENFYKLNNVFYTPKGRHMAVYLSVHPFVQ